MSEPLWSDDKINRFAWNSPTAWEAKRMSDAMRRVRNEMQARIDELEAQLAEAQRQLNGAESVVDTLYGLMNGDDDE